MTKAGILGGIFWTFFSVSLTCFAQPDRIMHDLHLLPFLRVCLCTQVTFCSSVNRTCCRYTTTCRFQNTQRTFLLKPIQDPLIWFKDSAVCFGFTWGFLLSGAIFIAHQGSARWASLSAADRSIQTLFFVWETNRKHHTHTHTHRAITTGSILSTPERTSDPNVSMKKKEQKVCRRMVRWQASG